jgi:hypothetical protein
MAAISATKYLFVQILCFVNHFIPSPQGSACGVSLGLARQDSLFGQADNADGSLLRGLAQGIVLKELLKQRYLHFGP